ncbi:MAG: transglycosylase SLT domain-containing protein [Exilibacterium sp.]
MSSQVPTKAAPPDHRHLDHTAPGVNISIHSPNSTYAPGNRSSSLLKAETTLRKSLRLLWIFIRAVVKAKWFTAVAVIKYCRRHPIHVVFNAVMLAILALVIVTSANLNQYFILNQISTQTLDEVVKASRFTRVHNAVRVKNKGLNELLMAGAPEWSQRESIRAVLFYARRENLSIEHQAVLLATVEIESGFNPLARAPTTTACGLFQFVKATGKRYKLSMENCMDPWRNAEAGVKHYIDNYKDRIQSETHALKGAEKAFRLFELSYYLHHDGPQSQNPSNDLKAKVLRGTQFLLQAYSILEKEKRTRQQVPTFEDQFKRNLKAVFTRVADFSKRALAGETELETNAGSNLGDEKRR